MTCFSLLTSPLKATPAVQFDVLLQIRGTGQEEEERSTDATSGDGCEAFAAECGVDLASIAEMTCKDKQIGFVACCMAGNYSPELCELNGKALFNESGLELVDSSCSGGTFCTVVADMLDAHHKMQTTRLQADEKLTTTAYKGSNYLSQLDATEVAHFWSSLKQGTLPQSLLSKSLVSWSRPCTGANGPISCDVPPPSSRPSNSGASGLFSLFAVLIALLCSSANLS